VNFADDADPRPGGQHLARQADVSPQPPFGVEQLLRFLRALLGSLDEDRAMHVLSREMLDLVGAELAAVYGARQDASLSLTAIAGDDVWINSAGLRSLEELAGRAMTTSALVRASAGELGQLGLPGGEDWEVASVPLLSKGRVLGVLVLGMSGKASRTLDPVVLATLAEVAASSLDNTRLFQDALREARRDPLTALGNRRAFNERLDALLANPFLSSLTSEVTLVLFDLDDFKQVNDRSGHPVGDEVLKDVARAVLRIVRTNDTVFRVGGEEFALVLDGGPETGCEVAERVRAALRRHRRPRALPTLSAGVASFPRDARTKEELVVAADRALYAAKGAGKDCVVIFEDHSPESDVAPGDRGAEHGSGSLGFH